MFNLQDGGGRREMSEYTCRSEAFEESLERIPEPCRPKQKPGEANRTIVLWRPFTDAYKMLHVWPNPAGYPFFIANRIIVLFWQPCSQQPGVSHVWSKPTVAAAVPLGNRIGQHCPALASLGTSAGGGGVKIVFSVKRHSLVRPFALPLYPASNMVMRGYCLELLFFRLEYSRQ